MAEFTDEQAQDEFSKYSDNVTEVGSKEYNNFSDLSRNLTGPQEEVNICDNCDRISISEWLKG